MVKLNRNNKQVISLFGASVIGMLFGIINSAVNTNYLSPDLYGNVRYVQNIINFFSSILLLGFFVSGSRLLALSDDENRSRQIRGGMVFILSVTQAILMIIMGIFAICAYKNHDSMMYCLYLAAIPTCGNVLLLNYINTTAQGDNHINRISLARILPPIVYLILAVPIFHYFGASSMLMLILFNGSAVVILGCIISSTRPKFQDLKETLRILNEENKKYGFHVYLGSIAGVSTTYIAGITLGQFCENNVNVGYFTLALSLATPLSLLPSIIGTSYFKNFAKQNKISSKVISSSIILTLLSLIIFIIGIKFLVEIVYPSDYSSVAIYASWIAIGTSCHGFGDMINRFLGSHGQGKQIRNASYACGMVILTGSIVLVYYFGIRGAICTRILGSFTYMVVMMYYYHQLTKCDFMSTMDSNNKNH